MQTIKNHKNYVIGAVAVIMVFALMMWYADREVAEALERTQITLELALLNQEREVTTVADLTKQNGADTVTEKIIVDCAIEERKQFDELLGQLSNGLSRADLERVDSLFYKCGRFFADRKAVMAARLLREVSVYQEYVALYEGIVPGRQTEHEMQVTKWQQIADNEMLLAEHFNALVLHQGRIIEALLSGKVATSPEIKATLTEVQDIRDQMTFLTKQNENLRADLTSI